jgi:hypothetical protein
MDGVVALIFAAASLEAFINELGGLAETWPASTEPPAAAFASLLATVEASRGATNLKFAVAGVVFTGIPYNRAVPPFQTMDLLFKVRDSIVHLKAEPLEFNDRGQLESSRPLLEKVRALNILAEYDPAAYVNAAPAWPSLLSTRAAATWACDVAADVVGAVLDSIPVSELRTTAEFLYRDNFRRLGQ